MTVSTEGERSASRGGAGRTKCVRIELFLVVSIIAVLATATAISARIAPAASVTPSEKSSAIPSAPANGQAELAAGNIQAALPLLTAAAERGEPQAQLQLANLYRAGNGVTRDPRKAFGWYLKAAEKGVPEAQAAIAEMYAYGYGVKRDTAKASEWALKAATAKPSEAPRPADAPKSEQHT